MKFVIFIVYLMLKSHKIVQLQQISSILFRCSFLTPKSANTPISYTTTFYHFLPTSTNFYHFSPNCMLLLLAFIKLPPNIKFLLAFTSFYHILCYFYQFLLLSTSFCQILPLLTNFYTTFTKFCHLLSLANIYQHLNCFY